MSLLDWSAYPTSTLWEGIPTPPDDDGSWGRDGILSILYTVLKKILLKHVINPTEPWGTVLGPELLAELKTAAAACLAGELSDAELRPYLDKLSSCLEVLARQGFQKGALLLTYEYAMDGPDWQCRLERRWLIGLPAGLLLAAGLHDREKELRTAFFPDGIGRRHPTERLRAIARHLLEKYAHYREGRWAWPDRDEVCRVRHRDGGVEL